MLPAQHSHIRHSSEYQSSSHSDLQSLNNLRNLLPSYHPISIMDNYFIQPNEASQQLGESSADIQTNELLLKISEQNHQILQMQEQLYYFKTEFFKIAKENQRYLQATKQFQNLQAKLLQLTLQKEKKLHQEQKNREQIQAKSQLKDNQIEALKKQLFLLQQNKAENNFLLNEKLNQQLRFQERVILQLTLKNENITKINLFLKQELRVAEKKLIQLEIELQQRFFGGLNQNLIRLKENHNNINKKTQIKQQTKLFQKQCDPFQFNFFSQADQDTIKLTSRRESVNRDDRYHREVKTLEKERQSYSPCLADRLKPLEQPKPQRKYHKAVDIQPAKKFKRNESPAEFFS